MKAVMGLSEDDLDIAPGQRVIELKDFMKIEKIEKIMEVALKKADDMTERAQIAFQQQEELGYQEGLDRAQKELSENIFESSARMIDFLDSLERKVVEVVMMSVKKIMDDFDDVDRAEKIVKTMLGNVKSDSGVVLRIAPDCQELIHRMKVDDDEKVSSVDVIVDGGLSSDSFVLETPLGVVDGSLQAQLANLQKIISRDFAG